MNELRNLPKEEVERVKQTDDSAAKFQAFAHLSRMHTSASSSFFTTFFAYFAYLGFLLKFIFPQVRGSIWKQIVLVGVPAIIPVYQFVKYYVTNKAVIKAGEDIKLSGDKTLYSYIWGYPNGLHQGIMGNVWLRMTQPVIVGKKNRIFWFSWIFFGISMMVFLFIFLSLLSDP